MTTKKKKKYTLVVSVNNELHIVETDTPAKTLLELRPSIISTKTTITLHKGKKSFSKTINVPIARRAFMNKLTAEIFINNLIKLLHD